MSLNFIVNGNISDIIPELDKALKLLSLLSAQLDVALFGALGVSLGAIQADLAVQLQAAIQAGINIGLSISNPFIGFQLALAGAAALMAQIQAALAGALPVIGLNVGGQLSAVLAIAAELKIKLGLLNAMIQVLLGLKAQIIIPNLALGPVALYTFEPSNPTPTLASVGNALATEFNIGLNPQTGLHATDAAYGIVLVTGVSQAAQALFKLFKSL